ncbi:MarR family winged helix-turn-helix transcriptional regulator [Weissella koreensis]|uniref:Winged helix-turn-helix transcriptional regulator n=1 Tax=Weissella koreensis TaxID=165096 RepID=A0A7H1MLW1_9LACO|nr:MarR family winged helix-turn-helix transcriptional regulator [Weissella koreensis]AVH75244.1 MarR family transcriptional regulator [Weissella koreensis]EJF33276.1 transcriptional regulator, MarR family [Weissella koreensis KCTC 3621]QGN20468.1 MarR family transcriptional regulator [Weissella koreensis]QNT64447.1 winged helix-turn-helix transcriptional regulator [Weissella koreensis]
MLEDDIFTSLIALVTFFNKPSRDKKMVENAHINLDPTAFPIFVGIARMQPTSVGNLADTVGKNHSSVSRQIDKLEKQGLVQTYYSVDDARIRLTELTKHGKRFNNLINETRRQVMREALNDWSDKEKLELKVNLNHLAETMSNIPE